jgi:hypothetical protein
VPFDKPKHVVSYGDGDLSFNLHTVNDTGLPPMKVCPPSDAQQSLIPSGVWISYILHRKHDNPIILPGASIVNVDGLCPEFDAHKNINLFGHYFGIKSIYDSPTYMRAILPFKFVSCFCLTNDLTYKLSHTSNIFCMDTAIPAITSSCIFQMIYDECVQIHCSNFEICKPHMVAAPASHVQLFLNGLSALDYPLTRIGCKLNVITPSCPQFFVLLRIQEPSLSATWTKQILMQTIAKPCCCCISDLKMEFWSTASQLLDPSLMPVFSSFRLFFWIFFCGIP